MGDELMKYAMVAIAIATLAFAVFSYNTPAAQPAAGQANAIALQQGLAASGALASSGAFAASSQCGDLNDDANVQHLSHHPDRYANCLKQVEAAVLKKATGKTLGQLIG